MSTVVKKKRMYEDLWNRIAKNEQVVVTTHKNHVLTLTRALYMEKSRNKTVKDATNQMSYGRLKIVPEPIKGTDRVKLTISIPYSGANL